jgi:predicted dinucleotide-binding enzyme
MGESMKITVTGGTGPQGKGLAQRFALACADVCHTATSRAVARPLMGSRP